ncbi:hypothetical protein BHE74_00044315 [Ensete ventricosum]|nr:hypothetical protein BHE74_00044315 [Ensete ventricosum]
MATASPHAAGCNQGPPARRRPAAARPPTRGGRMQPRPPYKGAGGCGHEPCKGRPTAGAATARGNDRLWPGCKGRLLAARLQGAAANSQAARGDSLRCACKGGDRKGQPTAPIVGVAAPWQGCCRP